MLFLSANRFSEKYKFKREEEWDTDKPQACVSYGKWFWSGKKPSSPVLLFHFSIFKTNVFAWPQNPPKSLFTQLYVQPSSNTLYLTVHIPISHWAQEYPRFLHATITPSISQQFLAKSNSIWQMMTWSQCDSCFRAHIVIQQQYTIHKEKLSDL